MISMVEGKYIKTVHSQLLVAPFKRVYNFIHGRPYASDLDTMASPIQLKIKLHNLHGEPIIVNVELARANKIYNELQQDEKRRMQGHEDQRSFPHRTTKEPGHSTSHK